MKIRERLTDIVNEGVVMFAVGLLLALAAPHIADFFHIAPSVAGTHDPLWTGAFFGAFGALHATVSPILSAAFGGKDADTAGKMVGSPAKEQVPQINIVIQTSEPQKAGGTKWQDYVQAKSAEIQQDSRNI